MKSKFMLLLMAIVFSSYTFSQNQNISRKAASDYSTEVSNILMNKDKYLSSKDVTVENNFATFTKDSSPFTGKYVEFQKNNVKSIKTFKNGIYDGALYFFYDNGNLLKVINFKNGYEEGNEVEFYSNGISKSFKNWKNGKLEGDSYEFSSDGKLNLTTQYSSNYKEGL